MNVVRMDGVTKRYRDVTALDGVGFELAENTIHGLLGRNGAGKTTIMQILTGQGFETAGTVEVFGQHPYENADVLSRVCFIKESQKYPDNFKVRHALRAAQIVFPHWDGGFAADLLSDFALPPDRKVKKLSRGMLSAVGVIIGPRDIAVASGLNAMAHGVEALWAPGRNPVSSVIAEEGIAALAAGLRKEYAVELLRGAWLTASAFAVTGSGLHHKLCHTLGGMGAAALTEPAAPADNPVPVGDGALRRLVRRV